MPSTAPLPPTAVTMEKAKELFAEWRANRLGRRRIPAHLWEVARQLIEVQGHTFTHVSTTLGINHQRLKHSVESQVPRDKPLPTASQFIKIDLPHLSQPMTPPSSFAGQSPASLPVTTLELMRPDGTLLKASGIASQDLLSFVQRFIA
jgi:hypothetical protein